MMSGEQCDDVPRKETDEILIGEYGFSCSQFWTALRPWSFTASLTPVILGSAISYKTDNVFNPAVFCLVCITALAVHAAGNLVNTLYDYRKGVDTKKSDDRTLVDRKLTENNVAFLGTTFYCIGCLALLVLVFISPAKMEHLAFVYFCGLSGSFLYTGGLGLKYIAVGDIVIFLTFGPITVMFAYLAATGTLSLLPLPYAIPLAMNIECVLHSNNCRDRVSDQQAGIVTMAILLGPTLSYLMFCVLLFGPYVAFAYVSLNFSGWFMLPTLTVLRAFPIERAFRARNMSKLPQKVAELNLILGLSFVISILMIEKQNLPFLV